MKRCQLRNSLILVLCALACAMTACRPKGVLSQGEMRSLLYDLHRAEGILQEAGYNYGHDEVLGKYYEQILKQHGITQAVFDSSLVWYSHNPQRFKHIYPKVLARLEAERHELELALIEENGRPVITDEQARAYLEQVQQKMLIGYQLPNHASGWQKPTFYEKMQKNEELFVYIKI